MIGVGGIAQGHVNRLLANANAEIVAVCDPSVVSVEKTIKNAAGKLDKAAQYEQYTDLLEKSKPDAVVICSRHSDHFQQIIDSLDSGAHVLTEKPLVNHVADALVVVERQKQTGKVVGIAYQRHTDPVFRFIRETIASGEFGKVQALAVLQQQGWKKGTTGSWRQDPVLSGGGQINDSGSHLVDILLWTTGLSPEQVAANIDFRGAPVDINSAITVKFRENAVGTITIMGDAPGWWEDITIWCDHGSFYVRNGEALNVQKPDGSYYKPDLSGMPGAADVDTNFINAILGTEEIAAPVICGLRTIELTEAAWKSAEQGGAVVKVARS